MSKLIEQLLGRENLSSVIEFSFPQEEPKIIFKSKRLSELAKRGVTISATNQAVNQGANANILFEEFFKVILPYVTHFRHVDSADFTEVKDQERKALNDGFKQSDVIEFVSGYIKAAADDEEQAKKK